MIIKNLIDNLLSGEEAPFAIEHASKRGWFMLDFIQTTPGKTEILWVKTATVCLLWRTEDAANKFISEVGLLSDRFKVTDTRNL